MLIVSRSYYLLSYISRRYRVPTTDSVSANGKQGGQVLGLGLGLEGCGLDSKSAFPISFSTLCLSLQSAALSIDPCNEDAVAHVLSQIIKDENIRLSNTDR